MLFAANLEDLETANDLSRLSRMIKLILQKGENIAVFAYSDSDKIPSDIKRRLSAIGLSDEEIENIYVHCAPTPPLNEEMMGVSKRRGMSAAMKHFRIRNTHTHIGRANIVYVHQGDNYLGNRELNDRGFKLMPINEFYGSFFDYMSQFPNNEPCGSFYSENETFTPYASADSGDEIGSKEDKRAASTGKAEDLLATLFDVSSKIYDPMELNEGMVIDDKDSTIAGVLSPAGVSSQTFMPNYEDYFTGHIQNNELNRAVDVEFELYDENGQLNYHEEIYPMLYLP